MNIRFLARAAEPESKLTSWGSASRFNETRRLVWNDRNAPGGLLQSGRGSSGREGTGKPLASPKNDCGKSGFESTSSIADQMPLEFPFAEA